MGIEKQRAILLCLAFGALGLIMNAMAKGITLHGISEWLAILLGGIVAGYAIYLRMGASRPNNPEENIRKTPRSLPPVYSPEIEQEQEEQDDATDIGNILDRISIMKGKNNTHEPNTPQEIPLEDIYKDLHKEIYGDK